MADADYTRRAIQDARSGARDVRNRIHKLLNDPDNRKLLTFAELKILGATWDVLDEIEKRLATTVVFDEEGT